MTAENINRVNITFVYEDENGNSQDVLRVRGGDNDVSMNNIVHNMLFGSGGLIESLDAIFNEGITDDEYISNMMEEHILQTILENSLDESNDELVRNPEVDFNLEKFIVDKNSVTDLDSCCICCSEYSQDEEYSTLKCGHSFHSGCIEEWVKYKKVCPVCRKKIE